MSLLLAARLINRIKSQHCLVGEVLGLKWGKVLHLGGTEGSSQRVPAGSGTLFKGLGAESTGSGEWNIMSYLYERIYLCGSILLGYRTSGNGPGMLLLFC